MRILGIETSGKVASVAILDEDKIISEVIVNTKLIHSVMLIDLIDMSLKNANLKIDDIELFAVAVGPGSFTGLRIGVATIKGFCYALEKPCIAVNTLEALCYNFYPSAAFLMPVLDAKSNKVFSGVFRFEDGKLQTYENTSIYDLDQAIGLAKKYNAILLGEGLDVYEFTGLKIAPKFLQYQRAANVCVLAKKLFDEGRAITHFELKPVYLKKSYAEGK